MSDGGACESLRPEGKEWVVVESQGGADGSSVTPTRRPRHPLSNIPTLARVARVDRHSWTEYRRRVPWRHLVRKNRNRCPAASYRCRTLCEPAIYMPPPRWSASFVGGSFRRVDYNDTNRERSFHPPPTMTGPVQTKKDEASRVLPPALLDDIDRFLNASHNGSQVERVLTEEYGRNVTGDNLLQYLANPGQFGLDL